MEEMNDIHSFLLVTLPRKNGLNDLDKIWATGRRWPEIAYRRYFIPEIYIIPVGFAKQLLERSGLQGMASI